MANAGKMVYFKTYTVEIPGDPKIPPDAPVAHEVADRDAAARHIVATIVHEEVSPRLSKLEEEVRRLSAIIARLRS